MLNSLLFVIFTYESTLINMQDELKQPHVQIKTLFRQLLDSFLFLGLMYGM